MLVKKVLLLFFLIVFVLFSVFAQELNEDNFFPDDEMFFINEKGITVTGTLQTSQKIAVIGKDEIENRNSQDIASLLQETLNLNITRYGTYGNMALINLRGLDSKRIAFLIDGVPVNSSIDGKFDIEQIDLNSVERIEVIYGGSDTKYNVSGAMGGVINIITVKKQKPGLKFGASVSNTSFLPGEYRDRGGEIKEQRFEDLADTQNVSLFAAFGAENFSFTAGIFANRAQNHFLFTDSYGYTRRKDNNEVFDAGGAASLVWEFSDLTKLITSSNFYFGDKNIPGSGFSSNFGEQRDLFSRNNLLLDVPRAFHDDLSAEASAGFSFNRRDFTSPSGAFSRHDQYNINLINRWSVRHGGKLILRSGFDYLFIYLDSTDAGNRNRHDGGIYITAEYKPVRRLTVIPSVKAVFTSEGDTIITAVPKLGFIWNGSDSFTIKNNFFRSFKFPDFEELYWGEGGGSAGNPSLRSEDGWGADFGVSWSISEFLHTESAVFAHWLKDSIHWSQGAGGIWRPENIGEAVFFGIENKVLLNVPVSSEKIKKITASVSYQFLLSYLLSFGYDFTSDKRIPYSPLHTAGAYIEIPWGTGFFSINGHYESARYQDRANLVKLKQYFLLNANFSQKIGGNLTLSAALRNILNTSYESFYDYPMPGISLTLSAKINLEIK